MVSLRTSYPLSDYHLIPLGSQDRYSLAWSGFDKKKIKESIEDMTNKILSKKATKGGVMKLEK
mgnify:CR=1 FL=1